MTKIDLRHLILNLLFFPLCCVAESSSLNAKLGQFKEVQNRTFELKYDSRKRAEEITAEFHRLFSAQLDASALNQASNEDLAVLFTAASTAMFYASSKEGSRTVEKIFAALESRRATSNEQVKEMHNTFVSIRDFARARAIQERFGIVDSVELPTSVKDAPSTASAISLWKVDRSKSEIEKMPFTFPRGPFMIMISSPNCHFSEDAITAIGKEPSLAKLFSKHGLFLAPQLHDFDFRRIQSWSASKPQYSFAAVNVREEWAEMREWATPTFYFFHDGALKNSFSGWPAEGNMERLRRGLEIIGLAEGRTVAPIRGTLPQ